jgi:hypothetical protein
MRRTSVAHFPYPLTIQLLEISNAPVNKHIAEARVQILRDWAVRKVLNRIFDN